MMRAMGIALATMLACGAQADDKPEWSVEAIPGESREVAIDVDNGTWMSLDVSPDGSIIAFDLLGDIYTLPIEGGEATAVHSGLSWSMQPRFSPDGQRIAFTTDAGGGDNIWVMGVDGADPKPVTTESFRLLNNPAWSPDGQYIAARKHFTTQRSLGTGEIWLYHVDGGSGIQVTERPSERHQKEIGEPVFSADGERIFFSVDATSGPIFQYAQDSNGQIFQIRSVDLATGEVTTAVGGAGGAVRPQPSPDGKYLAFVRRERARSHLFVKDLESGAIRKLYEPLDQDLQEVWAVHGAYPNFDWMPDSQSIVIWAGGKIRRIGLDGEVATIPFRVRDTRTVYEVPRPPIDVAPERFEAQMIRNASVAPDGSAVVFESAGKLYIKQLPNGTPRRMTRDENNFEFFPTWTPDSRRVVFVQWNDAALGRIASVAARGGSARVLVKRPGHYRHPRVSPDGKTIVFAAESGGYLTSPEWSEQTGILRVAAGGGEPVLVTDDGSRPHFGPERDRVYAMRGGSSEQQLVSMNLDGHDVHVHATATHARALYVAPTGSHLVFRENYHVYVLPLPPGGQPIAVGPAGGALPQVRLTGDGGNYPHFSADGRTVYWSLGHTLFSAPIEASLAAESYTPPAEGTTMAIRHKAEIREGVVALTGAKLITMRDAQGGVVENGVIVIDGNRIVAVGPAADVAIPEAAAVVDVSGKTIIPGLIDAHAHGPQGDGIIPQQNWSALATLALGVTTIHDPSNDATEIFAAAEMQRMGRILAPRIFSTGDIVYGAKSPWFASIDSYEQAAEHVRRLKAQGAVSIKNYNQPRRDQRQQVAAAARAAGMMVVAEGGSLFHMDLSMVADGNTGIEHNLPQSMLYDDVVQFWSGTEVGYTPTLVVTYGGPTAERYWYQHTEVWKHPILSRFVPPNVLQPRSVRREMAPESDYYHITSATTARQLAEAGVPVSIGAHGQREGLASHWEIWGFAQGGMDPVAALATATTEPARHLGFDKHLGSLEVGKLADLVVLDADPLQDIFSTDKVSQVMLNGRLYDAATMNETVTGTRRIQPMYWQ